LAWIAEKFPYFTHDVEVSRGVVDRDRVLTNVMLYWLTSTAGSSATIYYEGMHAGQWPEPNPAPTGVAVFGAEDIAIRRYAERGNNIVHWSEFDRGGHFAAMETPSCWSATCGSSSAASGDAAARLAIRPAGGVEQVAKFVVTNLNGRSSEVEAELYQDAGHEGHWIEFRRQPAVQGGPWTTVLRFRSQDVRKIESKD
jgi:hypothetical protein